MLAQVVTEDGYVDYDLLAQKRGALDDYVAWLRNDEAVPDGIPARLPFYLNAHNALALWSVLETGRPASVDDVRGWLPKAGSGFWFERAFDVGPETLSLLEIENERIRYRHMDYRVHAAMTGVAMSSPPLSRSLYQKNGISRQLQAQMERWVDDPDRGVRIEGGVAVMSPIFERYQDPDFTLWAAEEDLCRITADYASEPLKSELLALHEQGCPHRFFAYDARLNDARVAAVPPPK